jgi:hypothetical protein
MSTLKATSDHELKEVGRFMGDRLGKLVEEMITKGDIKVVEKKPNPKKPRVSVEIKGKKRDL